MKSETTAYTLNHYSISMVILMNKGISFQWPSNKLFIIYSMGQNTVKFTRNLGIPQCCVRYTESLRLCRNLTEMAVTLLHVINVQKGFSLTYKTFIENPSTCLIQLLQEILKAACLLRKCVQSQIWTDGWVSNQAASWQVE